jgi:hypothetical protein
MLARDSRLLIHNLQKGYVKQQASRQDHEASFRMDLGWIVVGMAALPHISLYAQGPLQKSIFLRAGDRSRGFLS